MNKVLVDLYVPVLLKSFEVYLPLRSKLYEVIPLLEQLLTEVSGGGFQRMETMLLCDKNSGIIFNINLRVDEIGLKNGAQLMLV